VSDGLRNHKCWEGSLKLGILDAQSSVMEVVLSAEFTMKLLSYFPGIWKNHCLLSTSVKIAEYFSHRVENSSVTSVPVAKGTSE
jgi:hypothetical protein